VPQAFHALPPRSRVCSAAFVADLNPYRAPAAASDTHPAGHLAAAPCPKCGAMSASKVNYNWWGGALGPRLFHVVKCGLCGAQYNGKTGGKLTRVIIVYQLVAIVMFAIVFVLLKGLLQPF
jgi:hypothetical protein